MNKNCQLFYKRLRTLFPSIGFAEGKFLRDIKMQLRDYSIENPNAEYEDVVKFFGNPEDVYVDYIRVQGREEVYNRFQVKKWVRYIIYILLIISIIVWIITFYYWHKSYSSFNEAMPTLKETIIQEGEYISNEND